MIELQNQGLAEEPKKAICESASELPAPPFEQEIQETFQPAQNNIPCNEHHIHLIPKHIDSDLALDFTLTTSEQWTTR